MHPLRRKSDLHRTLQEGRRFHGRLAVLHARRRDPNEEPTGPRLAVIAGRRFPTAVTRNRARRLLREACRVVLAGSLAPWDLVFVLRPEALELPYPARLETVSTLLHQAGVLAEKAAATR